MQKNVPIYPEWIKPLVVVNNNKPQNNLVCYNKGHILHQFTFFIGEVNFYWKDNFGYHCKEMNTGDSNYIPPFIPHSFTSRNKKELGLIIAVTFSDILSFSRIKFSLYNQKIIESFSGKNNIKNSYLKFFIKNHLNVNFIDNKDLIENMNSAGIKKKRACSIVSGEKKPNNQELVVLSRFLNISVNELKTIAQNKPLEVVNKKLNKNVFRKIECSIGSFNIWDLVKSKYASLIKAFIMDVSYETKYYNINHRLHEYVYNFDNSEIIVKVGNKTFTLGPEESIVFSPMIKHNYYKKLKTQKSKILIVRIAEEFSEDFIDMFAKLGKSSRKKIFSEASQWF